jgi:hypothetical protein
MKKNLTVLFILLIQLNPCNASEPGFESLFDGKTFAGWEGDTKHMWKIMDGAIVGGSLKETVPHNDFLCTEKSYDNFVLKLKFKLEGAENMNAGVQFRSSRLKDPEYEMIGYQADIADGIYGSLYDESRRKNFLCDNKFEDPNSIVNIKEWNDVEIRVDGIRIQIFINGKQTVDYREEDIHIIQEGVIGLQIHGGAKALVSYKDISIKELP